jgi:hypothetical protein
LGGLRGQTLSIGEKRNSRKPQRLESYQLRCRSISSKIASTIVVLQEEEVEPCVSWTH